MTRHLTVDRIRCTGHGLCAEIFPEGIGLDEWGYPIVKIDTIPPALLDHAKRAVTACPVLALSITRR